VLVHLSPLPVVARVTSGAPGVDPCDVERELSVARHAARAGAPVVEPSDLLPPGPHRRDGHTLVFWRYLVQAGQLDAAAAGRGLRAIHDALADYDGELPRAGRAEEVRAMLQPFAPSDDVELLCELASRELPEGQALHGDAHLFNCIQTTAGPIWSRLKAWSGRKSRVNESSRGYVFRRARRAGFRGRPGTGARTASVAARPRRARGGESSVPSSRGQAYNGRATQLDRACAGPALYFETREPGSNTEPGSVPRVTLQATAASIAFVIICRMTTLRDVVGRLDDLDEDAVIYTDGASPAANAVVLRESHAAEAKAAGLRYFLEVALARDAIDVWRAWRSGCEPTTDDKLMAVSYYAVNDAYLPLD